MSKILYLHNEPINSQMANIVQVRSMCAALSELGYDVTLSIPANSSIDELLIKRQVPFSLDFRKSILFNRKIDKYLNFRSVAKTIKRINPDLCYLRNPLLLKQALSSKKPIIIELHNNKLHGRIKWLDKYWKSELKKAIQKGVIKKVVCISQALSDYWISQGLPKHIIMTAHDAIDHRTFSKQIDTVVARKFLGIPIHKKIITYAGRLYENRKIEQVLEVAKHFPNCIFLIVGGPENRKQDLQAISNKMRLKNVFFKGQIPHNQIPYYLFASDVLLALWSKEVPTINYCSPLKLFEYMGSGRIIVAHGFPSIKEILKHQENALICEPDSLVDLISNIEAAISIIYPNKMAEKARKDVLDFYTWHFRAKAIMNSFNLQ